MRLLLLFPNAWDLEQLGRPGAEPVELEPMGDDLFRLPDGASLGGFDALAFLDAVVARLRAGGIDGVLSSDEYVGAILAAAAAQRCGLPGNRPEHVLTAQHKYYARVAQQRVAPEATPRFFMLPLGGVAPGGALGDLPLAFPFFVKPVKGRFSLYAARVDDSAALAAHLDESPARLEAQRRVNRPFNDLLRAFTALPHDADSYLGEELLVGTQVTVDGYVHDGEVHVLGVVDSVMFPGTMIFERFVYPSRLPPAVLGRMEELTERLVAGLGWTHGQFNLELFYDAARDRLGIIELNPRLSYQFADLYEHVDGCNTYDVLLDLTLGRPPRWRRRAGRWACAASLVFRTFEGRRIRRVPSADEIAAFVRRCPTASVKVYGAAGTDMEPEMRAAGCYRYAVVNAAAGSPEELQAIRDQAARDLAFAFA